MTPEDTPAFGPGPAQGAAPKSGFFRSLSPLSRVISALVAGISLVTGIIAIVPILTKDATNFSSLRAAAEPLGGELEFGLPSSAPFNTYPTGTADACTPAQQKWLEANGEPITTRFLVDLRNVASEGAMLALKSFRGDGKSGSDAPLIKVTCDPTGGSATSVQAARLLVSDPTQVAYFDKSAFNQTKEGIPDSPVVWNLAPGETGQLVLALFPTASFTGGLDVTAVRGTEQRDFPIEVDGKAKFSVPGLAFGGMTFLQAGATLKCIRLAGSGRVPCELSDMLGR